MCRCVKQTISFFRLWSKETLNSFQPPAAHEVRDDDECEREHDEQQADDVVVGRGDAGRGARREHGTHLRLDRALATKAADRTDDLRERRRTVVALVAQLMRRCAAASQSFLLRSQIAAQSNIFVMRCL